jgi:hypothetical protein
MQNSLTREPGPGFRRDDGVLAKAEKYRHFPRRIGKTCAIVSNRIGKWALLSFGDGIEATVKMLASYYACEMHRYEVLPQVGPTCPT